MFSLAHNEPSGMTVDEHDWIPPGPLSIGKDLGCAAGFGITDSPYRVEEFAFPPFECRFPAIAVRRDQMWPNGKNGRSCSPS